MSSIEEQVSDLPMKEKRALLSALLSEEADTGVTFPLSFAQQRLWFLAQLEPDNPSYNLPHTLRLQGELDVSALKQTINHIIARHESLRTRFKTVDGQPVQIVSDLHEVNLIFANLEDLPEAEREAEALRLANAEAWYPFDLSCDYPLRAKLVRLDHDHHWLLLTLHHIAGDGWSMGILSRELSRIYESITTDQPVELPELPIQYLDFAEWQREWLQGDVFEEQLNYWMSNLAGAPPELRLPTDRPRLAQQSFRGASVSSKLSSELSKSIRDFSQREGVTVFMTMLAAFQTLLFRYTGQSDIVVGTPIAGRNRVEIENLIGFFVNTLALRTNFSGNPTFRELLGRVKEVALGAYAHQDMPFEELVRELNPEREGKHSPVFQVMFGMQNEPPPPLTLRGLTISRVSAPARTAKFDLTLYATQTDSGLVCWFEYSADLFDEATIKRTLGHLETLLEEIVARPDERISALQFLTQTEREQLREWNQTATDYPRNECVHQLFESQVARTPNTTAVVFEGERLTYEELNARANQLAHYLRRRGVGSGSLVGICVERSAAMVVAMLGILKAGGAYVPLDLTYPKERLAFMLQDSQARVLLTQSSLIERVPQQNVEVICLDTDREKINRESDDNPVSGASAENLAYVIYTSGSTGKPKGVAVPHRAINRLILNTNYINLSVADNVAQASTASFDAATFEIWGALLNGARLVGFTRDVILSPRDFVAKLREHEISTIFVTTALFNQLASEVPEGFSSLRNVLFGGEAVDPKWVKEVLRNGPPERLLHVYGPTENTTFSTWYLVRNVSEGATTVPIGRAISNTQTYVLDRNLQLAPIGVPGELYISGDGLALGYLNRPAFTAERFVPNIFSNKPGARLYKTGDLVRYLPDGNIEFLSRIDHQIKLRGYRIELGEIETAIREHPAVQDTVVMLRDSPQGDKQLVGYVVADSAHRESRNNSLTSELKGFLRRTLPDYMVPAYFVFLEKLPITPGGKIDRHMLPSDGIRTELEAAHIAPRDELEQRLAHIWEKLLGVQTVGIRDNFFDLGGHSLLAVRLVSEIEKEVGQRLPLVSFFQNTNIECLASLLRQDVRSLSWPTLVEIQTGSSNVPPLFCVSMPNINALGYRSLARYLGPNQPVFGLQAQYPGDLVGGVVGEEEYSYAAIDDIAAEYFEALRAVQPTGPYQFVGLCRGAHIAYEIARRLEQEGEKVALLGILDTWVMENSYDYYRWHLEQYAHRLRSLMRLDLKSQLGFIKKKAKSALRIIRYRISPFDGAVSVRRKRNPILDIYFPGRDFVPKTYEGRIEVFRVRRQPLSRIRDPYLGWGKLARGGVGLHFIPGVHTNVLKEPHVQSLAEELKKCLLDQSGNSSR